MEISKELKKFCYDCIYELAVSFNKTLSRGIEYEACFDIVMDMLSVPSEARLEIFSDTLYGASVNIAGIPYHKLSPINQFIVTLPPYVFYCLKNKLPDNTSLVNEAARLMSTPTFPRYLQEQIGVSISQEIKGALWKPDIFKWYRKLRSRLSKKGEK